MAKYEAFPKLTDYSFQRELAATWNVVKRSGDGQVMAGVAALATFSGPDAEGDAKCHAAKLNEREHPPASPFVDPEFEVKERLGEEGEKFVAGMAAPMSVDEAKAFDEGMDAAITDPARRKSLGL